MKQTKLPLLLLLVLWGALTAWAWFGPDKAMSDAERRPLTQKPTLTAEALFQGRFMTEFEKYTLDQFPLRDSFRTLKAIFHANILGQKDNNGIYIADGFAVKQEYPMSEPSVDYALSRFQTLYDRYLTGSRVVFAIVPDKGQYLAETSGNLSLSYEAMSEAFRTGMPWAVHVSLLDTLSAQDFYRTDTHWRQENLIPAAQVLCNALETGVPDRENYTLETVERPFYGVYYGQAALPMEPDTLHYLDSPLLQGCTVYDYESGKTGGIYDREKLAGKDLYDFFLSGSRSLLTIENPSANTDRELIVFRDSFGSAIIPLLLSDYAKVTVVDIRYMQIPLLERYVKFDGQDVLMLYSTLVLNNSQTIK